jgi:DNA gyrase subunit B
MPDETASQAGAEPSAPVAFNESMIRVLDDVDHVRTRPGMYIGGLNPRGLHQLVYELVDNSLREADLGHARTVRVTLHADGACTVADDGRGIPVDRHPVSGTPIVEAVFDRLCRPWSVHGDPAPLYDVAPGVSGIGAAVVNFCSEWMAVEVARGGTVCQTRFERGRRTEPLRVVGHGRRTGTRITFRPDRSLFRTLAFDRQLLCDRLRELAALHGGVEVVFEDDRVGDREAFRFPDGVADYVARLTADQPAVTSVVPFKRTDPGRRIVVHGAMRYVDRPTRSVLTFVNDGSAVCGTHLNGFHVGLRIAFDRWADEARVTLDRRVRHLGGLRRGLVAVVAVRMAEPQYMGCTKDELGNPEVKDLVAVAVVDALGHHLRRHPEQGHAVVAAAHRSNAHVPLRGDR